MGRLKKIACPAENNKLIYVPKRILDKLNKKAIVLKQYVVGATGGKLVIEYKAKKGSAHGRMELYDMGPDKNRK